MKFCNVHMPYRGTPVYDRSAMGIRGSETALEELMRRVLCNLLQEGVVAKLENDWYCGRNSPYELLESWTKVLAALHKKNLRLSASYKPIINPKCTTILGNTWSQGTLTTIPHQIAVLSSCSPLEKLGAMISFIGAYKVLARVTAACSSLLSPIDHGISGRSSAEVLSWPDELYETFATAKRHSLLLVLLPSQSLMISCLSSPIKLWGSLE